MDADDRQKFYRRFEKFIQQQTCMPFANFEPSCMSLAPKEFTEWEIELMWLAFCEGWRAKKEADEEGLAPSQPPVSEEIKARIKRWETWALKRRLKEISPLAAEIAEELETRKLNFQG